MGRRSFGWPAALLLLTGILLLAVVPILGGLGGFDPSWWYLAGWAIAPALTALTCLRATLRLAGPERWVWLLFAVAGALWSLGTVVWWGTHTEGAEPFPSAADTIYLASALLFLVGLVGFAGRDIGPLRCCNLILILIAATQASFSLLTGNFHRSSLVMIGELTAVTYVALSIGATAFSLVCLALYVPPQRRLVGLLLFGGLLVQAVADFLYGGDILSGTYSVDAPYGALWIFSFALLGAAAVARTRPRASQGVPPPQTRWQRRAEAAVPALTVALFGAAQLWSPAPATPAMIVLALVLLVVFAATLGIRELLTMEAERQLAMMAERRSSEAGERRRQVEAALANTTDNVLLINRDWQVTYVNPRVLADGGPRVGEHLWSDYPWLKATLFYSNYCAAMARQTPMHFQEFLPHLRRWFEVHCYPTPDTLSVYFRDITEAVVARERLEQLAHTDTVTVLANRARFRERLEAALEAQGGAIALFYLDLDEFKDINDSLGHALGDAVLRAAAERLRALGGEWIGIARFGGDEFALACTLSEGGPAEAVATADRIMAVIASPVTVDGHYLRIGASMGVVLAPEGGSDVETLFRNADLALYAAKDQGGGTYQLFDPDLAARFNERQALKADLAMALERKELALVYQPIVSIATGQPTVIEALLRWRHPFRGEIQPSQFVPLAEETGLIVPIGQWALDEACRAAGAWAQNVRVAVNLSAVQFGTAGLPERVVESLRSSGLAPSRLELEITETVLLGDTEANVAILHQLRQAGIRVALDDFGTGYSSLGYLSRFPFDKLKIDRSFVAQIAERREARSIVHAVADLGRSLGITITAEGVETCEQLALLCAAGCDEAQGYLFSAPAEVSALPAILARLDAAPPGMQKPN